MSVGRDGGAQELLDAMRVLATDLFPGGSQPDALGGLAGQNGTGPVRRPDGTSRFGQYGAIVELVNMGSLRHARVTVSGKRRSVKREASALVGGAAEVFLLRHAEDMVAAIDMDNLARGEGAVIGGEPDGGAAHGL